jgi:hypothetical protein
MFCRVALHEKTPGSVASEEARGFRNWVKELPGFVDGYHVQNSKTGRMLSITIWESEVSMEALRGETPSGGLARDNDGSRGTIRRGGEVLGQHPHHLFNGVRGRVFLGSPYPASCMSHYADP